MATLVQETTQSGTATSITATFGSAITEGNSIVFVLSLLSADAVTPPTGYTNDASVVESGNSTVQTVVGSISTVGAGEDTTPTWSWTTSAKAVLWAAEYQGPLTADQTATATVASDKNLTVGPTATTTSATQLAVVGFGMKDDAPSASRTYSDSFVEEGNANNGGLGTDICMTSATKSLTATGTVSVTGTTLVDFGTNITGVLVTYAEGGGPTNTELVVADASHSHTADAPTLTQAHTLALADATHGHAADAVALTQAHTIAVADATHAHTADSVTLDVAATLTVADALHAHTADSVTLTQAHVLAIADALHSHSADNVTLEAATLLVVADALHAHTVDSPTLSETFAPPTGLTATAISDSQIDLAWDTHGAASAYDIERDGVVIVLDHVTTSYSDTGLDPTTTYTYRVRAVQ